MIKKALTTIILLAAIVAIFGQAADLFFSEYLEGSSNNKALEIFNGTGSSVDLSNYTVKLGSNGGEWSTTNIITLTGTLNSGSCFVIANAGANPTILGIAGVTSTVTYYNGDDAVALFNGTTMIDIIGVYQSDPGTAWNVAGTEGATLNHTLIRKPNVTQGNLDFITGAGTNQDDSEWIVFAQDYITDLGIHTFDPGATDPAATPTFDPAAGVYSSPINVTISCATPGADIRYTTNGSDPTATSTLYGGPVAISASTTLKAKAFATGMDPSYTATAIYTFPVMISNIAALRAATADASTVYHLTGEVILTFQQAWRHQKFIQDNTGAILIDDQPGVIITSYNIGDGITGFTGTLSRYSTGMLQFWPTMNSPAATSTGNTISPQLVTIAEINGNMEMYQSQLVRLNAVHYDNATGDYAALMNYNMIDATGTTVMRTQFSDANYLLTPMHTGNFNVLVIVTQFNTTLQVTPRMLTDFNPPVANDDPSVTPVGTSLIGNYPNPFNPETTISFSLDKSAPADVVIYNQKGQIVKNYDLPMAAKGITNLQWNGKDDNGLSVASGVYYFRLKSGSYSSTKKMVLMK